MQVASITQDYEQMKAETASNASKASNLTTGNCAICLDPLATDPQIWALVPCGHTNVCKSCFNTHILPVQAMTAILSFNRPSRQTKVTSIIRLFGVEREQHENLDT
jgi:hypothetical protein